MSYIRPQLGADEIEMDPATRGSDPNQPGGNLVDALVSAFKTAGGAVVSPLATVASAAPGPSGPTSSPKPKSNLTLLVIAGAAIIGVVLLSKKARR